MNTMLKSLKPNIGPSILSADFALLYEECQKMLKCGADSLHIDIMDGHFVPNLTIGPPTVKCLRKHFPKQVNLDCHIMVTYPEHFVQPLADAGATGITFHYESEFSSLRQLCKSIRQKNMKVGVSLKPATNFEEPLREVVKEGLVDMILVMTVEPGFGGQKFKHEMMPKLKALRDEFPHLDLQVDGGITAQNIQVVAENGANWIVSGTGIFGAKNPQQTMTLMRKVIDSYLPKPENHTSS